ncbi:hypothetical protein GE21DRAFT_3216 [Neurospora crassa]|uniref:Uncharacterized protein n=1 Tax=Neurospora crassa (strain ATCC 24698 / 74-OR23-1A / CBS 708.71 / DSM 1257 / FGSC 987) TaxID=367110 RepID=V5IPE8_NEUCR|nr:hypothetical protein NCU16553 [Neurospora crassa OR74A]ESA43600.1 hypothetical protein NCU16553 [Neurospora crassa OR74A]KHE79400.1 hypothetical protein GE21DRAFT_3216 [Neurospora crassa]|eukprot:XP_011393687.1 hypothetical protein NCU16553 [Neurospora crassa OR74A]
MSQYQPSLRTLPSLKTLVSVGSQSFGPCLAATSPPHLAGLGNVFDGSRLSSAVEDLQMDDGKAGTSETSTYGSPLLLQYLIGPVYAHFPLATARSITRPGSYCPKSGRF